MRASRAGLSSFTLDDLVNDLKHQAVTLVEAGRHGDRQLLKPRSARKRAAGFLELAASHGLVRRSGDYTWQPTVTETVIHVRPTNVGHDHAPRMQDCNGVQERLGDP